MKLELVSNGNHMIGSGSGKKSSVAAKNPWRGKHDRRKYPRESDSKIDMPPMDGKQAANGR